MGRIFLKRSRPSKVKPEQDNSESSDDQGDIPETATVAYSRNQFLRSKKNLPLAYRGSPELLRYRLCDIVREVHTSRGPKGQKAKYPFNDYSQTDKLYAVAFNHLIGQQHGVDILATGGDNQLTVYKLTGDNLETMFKYEDSDDQDFYSVAWANYDGMSVLLAAGRISVIRLIDVSSDDGGKLIGNLVGHGGPINDIKVAVRNGRILLLSASLDQSIRLWNVKTQTVVAKFYGEGEHLDQVVSVDWHPSLPYFVSAGIDHGIRVWSLKNDPKRDEQHQLEKALELSDTWCSDTKLYRSFPLARVYKPIFCSFNIHHNYVDCVQWCGPRMLMSKSVDGEIVMWMLGKDDATNQLENPFIEPCLDYGLDGLDFVRLYPTSQTNIFPSWPIPSREDFYEEPGPTTFQKYKKMMAIAKSRRELIRSIKASSANVNKLVKLKEIKETERRSERIDARKYNVAEPIVTTGQDLKPKSLEEPSKEPSTSKAKFKWRKPDFKIYKSENKNSRQWKKDVEEAVSNFSAHFSAVPECLFPGSSESSSSGSPTKVSKPPVTTNNSSGPNPSESIFTIVKSFGPDPAFKVRSLKRAVKSTPLPEAFENPTELIEIDYYPDAFKVPPVMDLQDEDCEVLDRFPLPESGIWYIRFAMNLSGTRLLACGNNESDLFIWDLESGTKAEKLRHSTGGFRKLDCPTGGLQS